MVLYVLRFMVLYVQIVAKNRYCNLQIFVI